MDWQLITVFVIIIVASVSGVIMGVKNLRKGKCDQDSGCKDCPLISKCNKPKH